MKLIYIYFALILSIPQHIMLGQTLDDAKALYLDGRYSEALPILRNEFKENPSDASLNQWLGMSLFKTGMIMEAEQYLKFASDKKIPEAYLALGELYTKLYRFDEADSEFEKYQRANRRNEEALERLGEARLYSDRIQRSINRTEDIQIIDSIILPKSEFLSAYNLSQSSGSILPLNEFFDDQYISDKSLYISEREDKVYYSREAEDNNSNLYTMDKLIESFGNEKVLPDNINYGGSQAYPFVMSDGLTIYFASTGHDSFGGYDIFVTRYNLNSDSYLTPNQMNMPFNSPFNDYMMVIDEEKGVGWFTSDRYQPHDSVTVYTFIPNAQVTLIESEEPTYMANRAKIHSIADTWIDNTDYDHLRMLANQKTLAAEETDGDFEFIINDKTTYYTITDFRNGNARSVFNQVIEMEQQLQDINKDLADKRSQYSMDSSVNSTQRLNIIELEKQSNILYNDIKRLKIQARNEEIRSLNN